jgi:hypothetical protein
MTKHTPGPWYAWNIQLGPEGKGPYSFPLGRDSETAAANARLIAAAPEMLEALREMMNHYAPGTLEQADWVFNGNSQTDKVLRHARAVLAKVSE